MNKPMIEHEGRTEGFRMGRRKKRKKKKKKTQTAGWWRVGWGDRSERETGWGVGGGAYWSWNSNILWLVSCIRQTGCSSLQLDISVFNLAHSCHCVQQDVPVNGQWVTDKQAYTYATVKFDPLLVFFITIIVLQNLLPHPLQKFYRFPATDFSCLSHFLP